MTNLPKHITDLINKIEAQEKAFGIVNMAKIMQNQAKNMEANDFHPLHGMARF